MAPDDSSQKEPLNQNQETANSPRHCTVIKHDTSYNQPKAVRRLNGHSFVKTFEFEVEAKKHTLLIHMY